MQDIHILSLIKKHAVVFFIMQVKVIIAMPEEIFFSD